MAGDVNYFDLIEKNTDLVERPVHAHAHANDAWFLVVQDGGGHKVGVSHAEFDKTSDGGQFDSRDVVR